MDDPTLIELISRYIRSDAMIMSALVRGGHSALCLLSLGKATKALPRIEVLDTYKTRLIIESRPSHITTGLENAVKCLGESADGLVVVRSVGIGGQHSGVTYICFLDELEKKVIGGFLSVMGGGHKGDTPP